MLGTIFLNVVIFIGIRVCRVRARGRLLHLAHHDQAPVQELHPHVAGDPDAELVRSHPDPRRPGLPRLRHRADRRRRMGLRPEPLGFRRDRRHLVDCRVPGHRHRAHRARHHARGRIAQRSGRPASARPQVRRRSGRIDRRHVRRPKREADRTQRGDCRTRRERRPAGHRHRP